LSEQAPHCKTGSFWKEGTKHINQWYTDRDTGDNNEVTENWCFVCAVLVMLSEWWRVTVARSSHGTPRAAVELPQQQPAEGEFRRMSDTQMTESCLVFIKVVFCPRIEAHASHLTWLFGSKALH